MDIQKLLEIANINAAYQYQLKWLAENGIDWQAINIFPILLSIILFGLVITSLGLFTPKTITRKFLSIGTRLVALCISLLYVPSAIHDLTVLNYNQYLNTVKINIENANKNMSLSESDKEILSYCLSQNLTETDNKFGKTHVNSGERFDKCIIRFVNIATNDKLKADLNTQATQDKIINELQMKIKTEQLGYSAKDLINDTVKINPSINLNKEQINSLINNTTEEIKEMGKEVAVKAITNNLQNKSASESQNQETSLTESIKSQAASQIQ